MFVSITCPSLGAAQCHVIYRSHRRKKFPTQFCLPVVFVYSIFFFIVIDVGQLVLMFVCKNVGMTTSKSVLGNINCALQSSLSGIFVYTINFLKFHSVSCSLKCTQKTYQFIERQQVQNVKSTLKWENYQLPIAIKKKRK